MLPELDPDILQILADHACLIFASLLKLPTGVGLMVYKSPLVVDTDPEYQPVREYLNTHRHEALFSETLLDPNMMFGRADRTLYLIHEEV